VLHAFFMQNDCNPFFENCLIVNNSNTGPGAAIAGEESSVRFNHCTIADINGMPRNALNAPDMRAYELQASELTIYVRKGASGSADGTSWANAIPVTVLGLQKGYIACHATMQRLLFTSALSSHLAGYHCLL